MQGNMRNIKIKLTIIWCWSTARASKLNTMNWETEIKVGAEAPQGFKLNTTNWENHKFLMFQRDVKSSLTNSKLFGQNNAFLELCIGIEYTTSHKKEKTIDVSS